MSMQAGETVVQESLKTYSIPWYLSLKDRSLVFRSRVFGKSWFSDLEIQL